MTESGPDGLLCGFDVEELKLKIARPPYTELWKRLAERTHGVIGCVHEGGFGSLSYGALAWHAITPMALEAAVLWRLEGDVGALAYVADCIRCLDRTCRDPAEQKRLSHGKLPVNSFHEMALAVAACRQGLPPETLDCYRGLVRDVCIDAHRGDLPYMTHGGGGNVSFCQTLNAAICALVWGRDVDHSGWRDVVDHGIMYTRCYLRRGCDPHGVGYEGTGYSYSVYHYMFLFVQLLHQNGIADLYATEPALKKICDATAHLMFPDASALVNINDHGLLLPASMAWLLYAADRYDEPLYRGLWLAYQGPDNPRRPYGDVMPWYTANHLPRQAPIDERAAMLQALLFWDVDAPTEHLPECGRRTSLYAAGTETLCWRTSWSDDAVFLNFLGSGRSHVSYTHRHADCGHFSIFAHGEYLAIDTGRYNCDENQHNVVMVDGRCHMPNEGWGMSHREGRLANVQSDRLLTYARADMAHMKDCAWADRHFLAVPLEGDSAYFVSIDNINKDNGAHSYWWQMQVNPECEIEIADDTHAIVSGRRARLDLTLAVPEASDYPDHPHELALRQDEAEWSWPYGKEGARQHADTGLWITSFRRPRLVAEVKGLNGRIMAVMAPRRSSEAALPVRIRRHARVLCAEIDCGAHIDTVVAALDHGCLRMPGVNGMTELAFIRRDRQGSVLASWTVDGSPLELA